MEGVDTLLGGNSAALIGLGRALQGCHLRVFVGDRGGMLESMFMEKESSLLFAQPPPLRKLLVERASAARGKVASRGGPGLGAGVRVLSLVSKQVPAVLEDCPSASRVVNMAALEKINDGCA